jgi:hypothetical protein
MGPPKLYLLLTGSSCLLKAYIIQIVIVSLKWLVFVSRWSLFRGRSGVTVPMFAPTYTTLGRKFLNSSNLNCIFILENENYLRIITNYCLNKSIWMDQEKKRVKAIRESAFFGQDERS